MFNLIFLVLGLVTSNTSYEIIKIPFGMALKDITCKQAFKKHTTWVENPNYQDGDGQIWGSYKHKGKTVFFHYCEDSFGKFVK
jgi:hypothetical protein